jgi:hypothetical protein
MLIKLVKIQDWSAKESTLLKSFLLGKKEPLNKLPKNKLKNSDSKNQKDHWEEEIDFNSKFQKLSQHRSREGRDHERSIIVCSVWGAVVAFGAENWEPACSYEKMAKD